MGFVVDKAALGQVFSSYLTAAAIDLHHEEHYRLEYDSL
jgi:hypothetical protein